MSKRKKYFLLSGSFLLPFFLLIILWSCLNLAPFGNNNLLVSDLGTQYMPFLSAFKQFFQGDSYSLYSFSDALGGTILPLTAYYLLSPFNFLVLLFPYDQLPIVILLIITLKISFMGTSMFYYLNKTYSQASTATLLFSTSYSLCGFVTVYSLNFMWLDALILLPLLVLGIQRLWDKKKYWLYASVLFFSIVTNYYMGYMLCIFAVCYSLYWYYQKSSVSEKKSLWHFIKEGRLFFVTSFFTGISTSFILIPAVEGMLSTNKTNFEWQTFLPKPKFGPDVLSQFGLGNVNFDTRLDHLPTVFSGILMVLLFLAYFQLSTISKKEKLGAAALVGFIFLSFWLELVNTIWHMFQSPAGFPYRNTFIFSFLIIKFAYEAFLELKKGEKLRIIVPSVFSALLIIGYISLKFSNHRDFLLEDHYYLFSLFSIWIIYGLIIFIQRNNGRKKTSAFIIMCLVVSFELSFNFWISFKDIPFGNQETFSKTAKIQNEIISDLENKQSGLSRIKQTINSNDAGYQEKNNGYNNPLFYGYAGVSSYTSTLEAKTQKTLQELGLYQKNDRRIAYVDESNVINLLLNVGYQVTPDKKANQEDISRDSSTHVYQNAEAIGMGFLVPNEFDSIKLTKNQPLKNQETILQSIRKKQSNYFQSAEKTFWSVQSENNYTLTVKTTANGELYLYIPDINWKKITSFKVNGKKIEPSIYIATNQIFNLGYYKKNEIVQLQLETEKTLKKDTIDLKTLSQSQFDSLVAQQKEQALQLTRHTSGVLTGTITVEKDDSSLLYLSIPYDKDWKITVDGKKVDSHRILGNFTGIELPSGTHKISMRYYQKNLIIGTFISISVLLGVFFYQLFKRISKKKSA
ncbi:MULTISPECIES: YfhO family protein [unclassified Enterococcus]|uniref:YfhO family protein n=1 Tax=unclassified Enterococcus TaxID=2608891 RepID=UPI001CE0B83B|nr:MULTISPECIES: YfhO family protein [unclassified Enterococcus]MCA5014053.1 YfhO family protein [Enterococcus sp. S23]MCA5017173.1 YfhO family protein [Enterococcus sp. S22(2020)]